MASKKDYHVLELAGDPSAELNSVLDYLEDPQNDVVAFDIETNSAEEKTAKIIGIGVSCAFDSGIYIPFRKYDRTTETLVEILDPITEKEFVAELCRILLKKKLVMHNAVFDITTMWHRYNIDLTPALYADTILMKHTIDEERPFGLKEVANLYREHIGFTADEIANQEQVELKDSVIANGGKWTQKQKDIYKGDLKIIGTYCIADVDLTLKLFDYFDKRMEKEKLLKFFYEEEVMPLCKLATIPMKMNGVYCDIKYFQALEKQVESGIIKLTQEIFETIEEDIEPFVGKILDEKIKETRTGKFAEGVLRYYSLPVPLNKKTGKPTLAKSALQTLAAAYPDHPALNWLLHSPKQISTFVEEQVKGEDGITRLEKVEKLIDDPKDSGPRIPSKAILQIKKELFLESNPELPHVFNLASNDHLSWLIFEKYGKEPVSHSRKTEKPKVDKDSLELYTDLPFVSKLLELKKEEKLLNTYIKPILETNVNGWLYPSMLQFGTTSGRYSCAGGLNLQTLPRDDKRIKKGFIAPPGYKVVNADFSSLEPRIFSWTTGDAGLKYIWQAGLDLYSQIAIDVFGLEGVSAHEKDPNYLKKVNPQARASSKIFTLAVPYGSSPFRIAQLMKIEFQEAQDTVNNYLNAYPGLKDYMSQKEIEARTLGIVKTKFGRIRHLPEAKIMYQRYGNKLFTKKAMKNDLGDFGEEEYYRFRNLLNNAKNAPIQMTAAHVCNAAMIELALSLREHKIDGWIGLQVHDEITCIIREDQAELVAKLLKNSMENNRITNQIDIPILAEPIISDNFADAK